MDTHSTSLDHLSLNLKSLMETRGLRLSEVSKNTKIPPTTLSHIINGITRNPTFSTLQSLADFFGYSVNGLMGPLPKEQKLKIVPLPEVNFENPGSSDIPVLDWKNTKVWCVSTKKPLEKPLRTIRTNVPYPTKTFAIELGSHKSSSIDNALLVVSPQANYLHDDLVLVSLNRNKPVVRIICEANEKVFLNGFQENVAPEILAPPHMVLGKIVEVHKRPSL